MKTKMIIRLMVLFALVALTGRTAFAWQSVDYSRMDRDIRISEDVLKNLFSERISKDFFRSNPKGAYIENYGVVFMAQVSDMDRDGDRAVTAQKNFAAFRKSMAEYFGDYADVIRQVKPNEKIALIGTPPTRGSSYNYFEVGELAYAESFGSRRSSRNKDEKFEMRPFLMSVKKSDISKFNQGSINESQLYSLISYVEIGSKNEAYYPKTLFKDIKIMRGILEMSVNDNFSSGFSSAGIQGTYLKDYGVLFTLDGGNSIAVPTPIIVSTGGTGKTEYIFNNEKADVKSSGTVTIIELQDALIAEDKKLDYEYSKVSGYGFKGSDEKLLNTIIESITDALANYGHTLRGLNPNDNVSVLFKSRGARIRRQGNKNVMLSVAIKDIMAYSNGSIDYETFKKRAKARTY